MAHKNSINTEFFMAHENVLNKYCNYMSKTFYL